MQQYPPQTPGAAMPQAPVPMRLTQVSIVDIDMPFGRMVVFILKWMLASIPAIIIMWIFMVLVMFVFGAAFGGLAAMSNSM